MLLPLYMLKCVRVNYSTPEADDKSAEQKKKRNKKGMLRTKQADSCKYEGACFLAVWCYSASALLLA